MIYNICGQPHSGKTTLANYLKKVLEVNNPKKKVFIVDGDVLRKILNNKEIFIKSNYLVNRSYCDISQLLNTLVTAAKNGYSGTLDSTGIKIELRDLAKQVIKELKSKSKFDAPEVINGSLSDDYFSESKEYSHLLNEFSGGKMFSIEQQIHKTRNGLILTRFSN